MRKYVRKDISWEEIGYRDAQHLKRNIAALKCENYTGFHNICRSSFCLKSIIFDLELIEWSHEFNSINLLVSRNSALRLASSSCVFRFNTMNSDELVLTRPSMRGTRITRSLRIPRLLGPESGRATYYSIRYK